MIEIHSHILHSIDDGASSWDVSVELLREYAKQGVKRIICTPHFEPFHCSSEHSINKYNSIRLEQIEALNSYSQINKLGVELYPGAEIILAPDCLDTLTARGRSLRLTLADSDYVLVELPRYMSGGYALLDKLLFNLQMNGFIPILAHPERAMSHEGMFETLLEWYEQGRLLLQLNASSIITNHKLPAEKQERYTRRKKYAKMLLDAGIVHFVSSDAHNTDVRPPQNKRAFEEICHLYGCEAAEKLMSTNADAIISKMYNL